jgi:hypothetical protein
MNGFIIYNRINKLYWNNKIGWVDKKMRLNFLN